MYFIILDRKGQTYSNEAITTICNNFSIYNLAIHQLVNLNTYHNQEKYEFYACFFYFLLFHSCVPFFKIRPFIILSVKLLQLCRYVHVYKRTPLQYHMELKPKCYMYLIRKKIEPFCIPPIDHYFFISQQQVTEANTHDQVYKFPYWLQKLYRYYISIIKSLGQSCYSQNISHYNN